MIIKEIEAKNVITKSNLPVCDFSVNPYTGCEHSCKYCYACFMKRFTNHPEEWGKFVDVKIWKPIKNPGKYNGKALHCYEVRFDFTRFRHHQNISRCPCIVVGQYA